MKLFLIFLAIISINLSAQNYSLNWNNLSGISFKLMDLSIKYLDDVEGSGIDKNKTQEYIKSELKHLFNEAESYLQLVVFASTVQAFYIQEVDKKNFYKELENQVVLTLNNFEYLKLKLKDNHKAINNKILKEDVGQFLKIIDKIIDELKKSKK